MKGKHASLESESFSSLGEAAAWTIFVNVVFKLWFGCGVNERAASEVNS